MKLIFLFFLFLNLYPNEFLVSPVFPVYVLDTQIYSTLEGVLSLYPSREKEKISKQFKSNSPKKNLTSFASIKIDNEIFQLNQFKSAVSEWDKNKNFVRLAFFHESKEVLILFDLKTAPERKNFLLVSYEIKNLSKKDYQIGLRIFQDISNPSYEHGKLGIFSNQDNDTYSNEIKFTPFQSPYWETEFDKYKYTKLRTHLLGEEITPPDKIAFTKYETSHDSEWDYFTKKSNSIESDSAVIMWWEPKFIAQGSSLQIKYECEISNYSDGFKFDLVNPNSGFGRLKLAYKNPFKEKITVSYQFESFPENSFLMQDYKTTFSLFEGEHFDKSIPMTILGKRNILLIVKETRNGVERKYSIPINLSNSNRAQTIPFQIGNIYRINYSTDKTGLNLKAKLKDKKTNKALVETDLFETKNTKDEFLYYAEVDLKDFYGEVIEEIYIK